MAQLHKSIPTDDFAELTLPDVKHHNYDNENHSHIQGAIAPEIASSEGGIWAVKWSLVGLSIVAQAAVFCLSGNVALLADLIRMG